MTTASALRITRHLGAGAFIVVRWLSAVCNVPTLCDWLAATSWLLAAVLASALLRSPVGGQPLNLGRLASRLLLLTCAINLVAEPLAAVGTEAYSWVAAVTSALDLLAWGWALYGALVASRWLWNADCAVTPAAPRRLAPRHASISVLIVMVLGLQLGALFKSRPSWWPFIDYPLYSSAHRAPISARHFQLYGVSDEEPPMLVEITAQALGMSWFVYHTQLLPRMFDRPWSTEAQFRSTLLEADLPPFRAFMVVATLYELEDGRLVEHPEMRRLAVEPIIDAPGAGDPVASDTPSAGGDS